jgi:glycosyltransferase involved in cell wall biosynthesis
MRAAILTAFDPQRHTGGIESYVVQLRRLMEDRGVEVDVIHGDDGPPEAGFHNELFARIYRVGRDFRARERDYDVVITNSFYGVGYFPRRCRTVNIYHATHAAFADAVKPYIAEVTHLEWGTLCGYLGEMAGGVYCERIAVSDAVAGELDRYYGFDGVPVVESGVDLSHFRPRPRAQLRSARLGIPEDAFVGLFIGRWDITKGVDLVERLAAAARGVHWMLVLGTGSGECPVAELDNVTVLGAVSREDLPAIYAASDFMLFPSRYEGFGLVVIEALACGLPVLATPVGVARSLQAQPPFDACRIAAFDAAAEEVVADVLERIRRLRDDEPFRRAVVREGLRLSAARYDARDWAGRMGDALGLP